MADKHLKVGSAGVGVGFVASFGLDSAARAEIVKWFATRLSPETALVIVCLGLGLAIAVATNWIVWSRLVDERNKTDLRLKEKDDECATQQQRLRESWKAVVDQYQADNKEQIRNVAEMIKQITILGERMGTFLTKTRNN